MKKPKKFRIGEKVQAIDSKLAKSSSGEIGNYWFGGGKGNKNKKGRTVQISKYREYVPKCGCYEVEVDGECSKSSCRIPN